MTGTEVRRRCAALFEMTGDHPGRNLPMEGLRGVAVLLVFFVHFQALSAPWVDPGTGTSTVLGSLWSIGHDGVDLFFVLSGFLIYGTVIRRRPSGAFFRRRFQRIYPAFLAVFIVYVGLSFVFPGISKIPGDGAAAVVYLGENLLLLPGLFPIEPLVTVAWSLSYEVFYYLAIPLLVTVTRMWQWSPRARVRFFVAAAAALTVLSFFTEASHVRLLMFIAGILVYEFTRTVADTTRTSPVREWAALAVAVAGVALSGALMGLPPAEGTSGGIPPWAEVARVVLLGVAFGALCWSAMRARYVLRRSLSWTPLRWLGNMSYSYYLVHGLALQFVFLVLARVVPGAHQWSGLIWLLLPVALLATIVPAVLLFATVERPMSLSAPAGSAACTGSQPATAVAAR